MIDVIDVISLGSGVQSSTVFFAADNGLITPRPVAAIMADTKREPKKVYSWLKYLIEGAKNIPIIVASAGDLGEDGLVIKTSQKSGKIYQKTLIPFFIKNKDGTRGILPRKCTSEYKIRVVQKEIRKIVGAQQIRKWQRKHRQDLRVWNAYLADVKRARKMRLKPPPPPQSARDAWELMQRDALVRSWIGISTDEAARMSRSHVPWIVNRYPLIEMGMSRNDCKAMCAQLGHPEPPRSACTFCPYHSDEEWLRLKNEEPEDFAAAVEWEKLAREANAQDEVIRGQLFVHDSLVPLGEIDFEAIPKRPTQVDMFDNVCEGMCGV